MMMMMISEDSTALVMVGFGFHSRPSCNAYDSPVTKRLSSHNFILFFGGQGNFFGEAKRKLRRQGS